METSDGLVKKFKLIRLMAVLMLIVAPAIYLVVANLVSLEPKSGGEHDIMFYILLLVALSQPSVVPLIERFQIGRFRHEYSSKASPVGFLTVMFLTRFAVIEAVYIWGLVILFVTGDLTRALLFIPIGAIWSIAYWPRKDKMKRTLERLETL